LRTRHGKPKRVRPDCLKAAVKRWRGAQSLLSDVFREKIAFGRLAGFVPLRSTPIARFVKLAADIYRTIIRRLTGPRISVLRGFPAPISPPTVEDQSNRDEVCAATEARKFTNPQFAILRVGSSTLFFIFNQC